MNVLHRAESRGVFREIRALRDALATAALCYGRDPSHPLAARHLAEIERLTLEHDAARAEFLALTNTQGDQQ